PIAPLKSGGAKRIGLMSRRSKSHTESRERKRLVTNWPSNCNGNCPTSLFILPEAEQALSGGGKRSMRWRNSVGSAKNGHGCSRSRPRAARPSFVPSKREKTPLVSSLTRTRLPPDYVCQKR